MKPLKPRQFVVTLDVTVVDPKRLIRMARDRAEECGCSRGDIHSTRDAVLWLLDPGSSPFDYALEIENGSIEEVSV